MEQNLYKMLLAMMEKEIPEALRSGIATTIQEQLAFLKTYTEDILQILYEHLDRLYAEYYRAILKPTAKEKRRGAQALKKALTEKVESCLKIYPVLGRDAAKLFRDYGCYLPSAGTERAEPLTL